MPRGILNAQQISSRNEYSSSKIEDMLEEVKFQYLHNSSFLDGLDDLDL